MSSTIRMDSRITAIRDQMSCDLDGEAVILAFNNGVYYTLNPVGTRIWNLIQEPRQVNKILDTLMEEFDVDDAACKKDVIRLLQELQQEGLIIVENIDS